ncbi:MAG: sulfotransferase [Pirellulales bacterium]
MSATRPQVTVVSGLPRSGTSMMMRMLHAGGMPLLADGQRAANGDNPGGFYEFEPVKQTRRDASWLDQADGKAVKMVYRLLYDLPHACDYRVLFMRRNLDEVLASQRAMLQRAGQTITTDDGQMAELFRQELKQFDTWAAAQSHFTILDVSYSRLVTQPQPAIAQIVEFLQIPLDQAAMEGVVDLRLYRQRK